MIPIVPVQIRPQTVTVTVQKQKKTFETGKFEARVYVGDKWKKIPGVRDSKKACYGDVHKWAVDRGMWFDEGRMQVKGTVLK